MLAEGYKRRGLLCFETLILCLTAASMAQGGKEKLSAAPDPFLGFSLKDFKLVDQNFAEASIPSGQKSQIAVTLAAVLNRGFEDERLYADAKGGSDRPTSRQRREILNQSAILAIAALPNNGHLYIVRIVTFPPHLGDRTADLKSSKLPRRARGFLAKASVGAWRHDEDRVRFIQR